MMGRYKKAWRRFQKAEDGAVVLIEFVILMPLVFGIFLLSIDMSLYSLRQVHLNRGLEDAVRYIRLHTRTPITHTMIKDMICSGAGTIGDCENTLRLEMVKVDPRAFSQLDQNADCVDKSLPVEPERGFVLGKQHELMLLRACVKFDTMLPGSNYGFDFETDGSGQGRMMAIASFVQEPN